ncbi:MAG: hypothetical protein ACNFW9_03670 [Candidatus Kerfeldbacteria bacterium]|jgi:N-acetylglutamate synthase-like GNAT family acetyltransferase
MIKIRKANCKDGQAVSELLKSKYSYITKEEAVSVFEYECMYQHYRIAHNGDKVVGIISWRTQGTEKHGVAELTKITVLQDISESEEVKEMLFDVMVAEADYFYKKHNSKLRKVFSMIHTDNIQIKNFFENKGMHQEAILKNHFHAGKDELVFSLFFN